MLLAAGAVPASMRKEWEALKTAGSRKNQSKFIEDMVVRDDKTGRLALSFDKGSLEASMALKHKSKTGWGDKGLSKTLFKGKFGLTDEMTFSKGMGLLQVQYLGTVRAQFWLQKRD